MMRTDENLVIEYLNAKAQRQAAQATELELFNELYSRSTAAGDNRKTLNAAGHQLVFKPRENIKIDMSLAGCVFSEFLDNNANGFEMREYPFKTEYKIVRSKLEAIQANHPDFYRETIAPAITVTPGKPQLEIKPE